jgi:Concanavalin A-like lectin/glucanases superfamily
MRTKLIGRAPAVAATFLALLAFPAAASAATVSLWHMDETAGSTMLDSVGANNGTLSHVGLGQVGVANGAYGFDGTSSIITVPSSATLNPGSAAFTASAFVQTTTIPPGDSADVVRKGIDANSPRYWKMEIRPTATRTKARVRCYFQGSSAIASVSATQNVADGAWHQIQCVKRTASVSAVVDGKARTKSIRVGSISNAAPLTVGAKSRSEDFYRGLMDEVSFAR